MPISKILHSIPSNNRLNVMLNIVLLLMILQSYLKLICDTCTFTTINLSIAIVSETFPKTGKCISSYALHKMSYLSS